MTLAALEAHADNRSTDIRSAGLSWKVDIAIAIPLTLIALAIRLPNYQLIPVFTDETEEIYRALLTARGQIMPLTNVDPYIGSMWNWLLAAALRLSDFSLYAPRTVVLAFGVLTVAATYLLGRAWAGQLGGLLACALMATAAVHVVVNSHVAYSNCITPLFTTLGAWALYEAARPGIPLPFSGGAERAAAASLSKGDGVRRGLLLAMSGLCWGLALQTHPSAIAFLPGAVVFLVWTSRRAPQFRWWLAAAALFVTVNLNLGIYNLATGLESLRYGNRIAASYTPREELTPIVYLGRVARFMLGLLESLGGAVDLRVGDVDYLLDLALWPIAVLALAGVFWQWRRGNPLAGLLLISSAAVLPLFNGNFEPVLRGRYLMPLLPVLFAGVGCLAAELVRGLTRAGVQRGWLGVGAVSVAVLAAALALHPLTYLTTYYQQVPIVGRTNARIFQTLELISSNRQSGEAVIIDQQLQEMVLGPGAGRIASAFRLGLALKNIPFRMVDLDSQTELSSTADRCHDLLLLLGSRRLMAADDAIIARLTLRDLDHQPAKLQNQASRYGLYRLDRRPDVPPC